MPNDLTWNASSESPSLLLPWLPSLLPWVGMELSHHPRFGRNKGWNTWEYTEYSNYQTGWDMSHYVPPILNFVKELHVAKQHPSRRLSLCESSKVKTDHFRVLFPFQNASPLASFFSSPFFFTKNPSNHSSNQSFCSLLGFCFGGWRWFLSLTKSWDKRMVQGMKTYPMRNHLMKPQMHPITHWLPIQKVRRFGRSLSLKCFQPLAPSVKHTCRKQWSMQQHQTSLSQRGYLLSLFIPL